jgi:uncharacterized surface protein with fasciclin (FAS1) repeats
LLRIRRSLAPEWTGEFVLPGAEPVIPLVLKMLDSLSEGAFLMNTPTRRSLAAAVALVAAVGLAACSGDDNAPLPAETATPLATSTVPVAPEMVGLVGPGCADYAEQVPDGAGSVAGMSDAPLVAAASKNPLLKSLTKAVSGKLNKDVNLVDTLNGGDYTVFAPVDDAFAKLPAASMAELKADGGLLVKTLTYHLVAGRLAPEKVVGTQTSVEGGAIKITGSGAALKVNDAQVICGGIRTANATVYLIDTVLTPPK